MPSYRDYPGSFAERALVRVKLLKQRAWLISINPYSAVFLSGGAGSLTRHKLIPLRGDPSRTSRGALPLRREWPWCDPVALSTRRCVDRSVLLHACNSLQSCLHTVTLGGDDKKQNAAQWLGKRLIKICSALTSQRSDCRQP